MKRSLLLAWVCLAVCCVQAQPGGPFRLDVHLQGQDTARLDLGYYNGQGQWTHDTEYVRDGHAVFTGTVECPTAANLVGRMTTRDANDPHILTDIYIGPGTMSLTLEADNYRHYKLEGSSSQQELEAYFASMKSMDDRQLAAIKANQITAADSIGDVIREDDIRYAWIHPDSYIAPQLIFSYIGNRDIPLDSAENLFHHFSAGVRKTRFAKLIAVQLARQEKVQAGLTAHDFTFRDMQGRPVTLSDFRGKDVVLLDFWASWCVPCRAFTPHLMSLQEKYRNRGLVVLTVSIDNDAGLWRKAVKDDHMERLCDVHAGDAADSVQSWYAIQGIPADILIDKQGLIAGRYMAGVEGQGQEALDKAVAELLR